MMKDLEHAFSQVSKSIESLDQAQAELTEASSALLARKIDLKQSRLKELLETREALLLELGAAVFQWRQAGGVLDLVEPTQVFEDEPPSPDFLLPEEAPKKQQDPAEPDPELALAPEAREDTAPESLAEEPEPEQAEQRSEQEGEQKQESEQESEQKQEGEPEQESKLTPPATREQLRALVSNGIGPKPSKKPIFEILAELRRPQRRASTQEYQEDLSYLYRIIMHPKLIELPSDLLQQVLRLFTAWARELQEHTDVAPEIFSVLGSTARYAQVYVYGLRWEDSPARGSWYDDAVKHWEKLNKKEQPSTNPERALLALKTALEEECTQVELGKLARACLQAGVRPDDPRLISTLDAHLSALKGGSLKQLRKAIRKKQSTKTKGSKSKTKATIVPQDWPYFRWTAGKSVLIVGGTPRSESKLKIKKTFRFQDVCWEDCYNTRRIESLKKALNAGKYDMVLLLTQYLSHEASYKLIPICKSCDIPFITIENGYGPGLIKYNIEKTMQGQPTLLQ